MRANRPDFGLGPWSGARVAPLRCPILRPGRNRLQRTVWHHATPPLVVARQSAPFRGFLELAVALGEDQRAEIIEPISRGDVTQSAVQTDMVVVLDEVNDPSPRLFERGRARRPDAAGFDGLVVAFELTVGLGNGKYGLAVSVSIAATVAAACAAFWAWRCAVMSCPAPTFSASRTNRAVRTMAMTKRSVLRRQSRRARARWRLKASFILLFRLS